MIPDSGRGRSFSESVRHRVASLFNFFPTPGARDFERPTNLQWSVALLIGWFYWLVRYPYSGIEQDAIVYALLVARHLDPSAFANELYFIYGSQDSFSLFTPIYGWMVSQLGLDLAARSLVLVGGAAWVAACLVLSMIALRRHWLGSFAFFVLVSSILNYSPNYDTFQVYEHFATARSVAFPLAVLSLAAAVTSRSLWGLVCGVAATLLHPLLGIWTLLLWGSVKLPERLVVGGLVVVFSAILSGPFWSPFGQLQLMDPEWAKVVSTSTKDVFVGGWGELRLSAILFCVGLLWLGARHGDVRMRPWYQGIALLTVWAVLISLLCSQFFPIRIVMQAQPWRVLWLAEVLGVVALADLLRTTWDFRRTLFWLALGLAASLWAFDAWRTPWPLFVVMGMACRPVLRGGTVLLDWIDSHRKLAIGAAIVLVAALLPRYWLSLEIAGDSIPVAWGEEFDVLRGFFLRGGEGVLFLLLAWLLGNSRWRLAIGLLTIPATAFAMSVWDVRGASLKQIESRYLSGEREPVWAENIRQYGVQRGDVVAWSGNNLATWLILRNPFYAAPRQAVGIVFSEPRTVEIRRRLERVALASLLMEPPTESAIAKLHSDVRATLLAEGLDPVNLHKFGRDVPSTWGAKYLCADPLLAWVVISYPSIGSVAGLPFDPGRQIGGRQYLFSCKQLLTAQ